MHLSNHVAVAQYPRSTRRVVAGAWLLIAVKCGLIWWAVGHWHMPFHPLWVVGPTLAFAGLATGLWLTHRDE